jgi:hypothetical protein
MNKDQKKLCPMPIDKPIWIEIQEANMQGGIVSDKTKCSITISVSFRIELGVLDQYIRRKISEDDLCDLIKNRI